jgi:hypothetical protein
VPKIREAGLGVVAHDDSGGDVRSAVIGTVPGYRQGRQVNVVFRDDVFVHWGSVGHGRRDAFRQPVQDVLDDVVLSAAESDQRFRPGIADTTDQREGGADVLEDDSRTANRGTLAKRLLLPILGDGTIDLNQLPLRAEGRQEGPKILKNAAVCVMWWVVSGIPPWSALAATTKYRTRPSAARRSDVIPPSATPGLLRF